MFKNSFHGYTLKRQGASPARFLIKRFVFIMVRAVVLNGEGSVRPLGELREGRAKRVGASLILGKRRKFWHYSTNIF